MKNSNYSITKNTKKSNIFEAVKSEVNIGDVYNDLTSRNVTNFNKNVSCPLPEHEDRNPSCNIDTMKNVFNCLGCGAGGSVIDMVKDVKGISALEAAKRLAEKYNIEYEGLSSKAKKEYKRKQNQSQNLKLFIKNCYEKLKPEHIKELTNRGISKKNIKKYKIGYCPRVNKDKLNNKTKKFFKSIGVINDKENFIFRDRIIIPFYKYKDPVYFVGWNKEQKNYKYLNPAGMEKPIIFHKASTDKEVYLVEGVFDFYSLVEAEKNVIAVLGSKTKDNLIKKLKQMKDYKIYIAFDGDKPGQEAAEKLAQELWPEIKAEILNLPENKDINDIYKDDCNCNINEFEDKLKKLRWEDPIDLIEHKVEPLPVDILPDWLQDFAINVSESTQTPISMSILITFSILSAALANKAAIKVRKDYSEALILWTMILLGPGNRKSSVIKKYSQPVYKFEEEKIKEIEPEIRHKNNEKSILEDRLNTLRKQAAKAKEASKRNELINEINNLDDEINNMKIQNPPRVLASDITNEYLAILMKQNHGRIAIIDPEGGPFKFMGRRYSNNINLDIFKKSWTGGETYRDDRMGRKGTFVKNPALVLGLALQPQVLEDLQNKEVFKGEGILGRFLYAIPDSPVGNRKTGNEVPEMSEIAKIRYQKGLHVLLNTRPANEDENGEYEPHIIKLTPEALKYRNEFDRNIEGKLGLLGSLHSIDDWGSKLVGNMVRVAGLLHIAGQIDAQRGQASKDIWNTPITGETMKKAVKLGYTLIKHAKKTYNLLDKDPDITLAKYVLKRIIKGKEMEKNDELKTYKKNKLDTAVLYQLTVDKKEINKPDDLKKPLKLLEEFNYIKIEKIKHEGPGRPPSPKIKLNPKVDLINLINPINYLENNKKGNKLGKLGLLGKDKEINSEFKEGVL